MTTTIGIAIRKCVNQHIVIQCLCHPECRGALYPALLKKSGTHCEFGKFSKTSGSFYNNKC